MLRVLVDCLLPPFFEIFINTLFEFPSLAICFSTPEKTRTDINKNTPKLILTITLLKFKNTYTKPVKKSPNIGPLLPVANAKMKKMNMSEYLYIYLIFTGRNKSVIIPKPIHLAKTIGPPPKTVILPSALSVMDGPKKESNANKHVTASRI